ncbi:MAG TPA: hypothetical protein VF746_26770 [Longimicrobium sp.]|jgi:hypothetical protein
MDTAVTLVHGTFARGAPWTQPGSSVRAYLGDALGADTQFEAFEWSGLNTHEARLAGGRDLARRLREKIAANPALVHFIVAHSHGGNVAVYALRELSEAEHHAIAGVVCFATPFLRYETRALERTLVFLQWPIPIALAWLAISVFWFPLTLILENESLSAHPAVQPVSWLLGILGVLAMIYVWRASRRFFIKTLPERVRQLHARVKDELTCPVLRGIPFYCVKLSGDEAKLALGVGSGVSEVPSKAWGAVHDSWEPLGVGLGMVFVLGLLAAVLGFDTAYHILIIGWALLGFALVAIWLALAFALPVIGGLTQLRNLAFGRGEISANPWLGIIQYDVPLTDPKTVPVRPSARDLGLTLRERIFRTRGILHSVPYESSVVLRNISQWMSQRLESRKAQQQQDRAIAGDIRVP